MASNEVSERNRQAEWSKQWDLLCMDEDQPGELFFEWIAPNTLDVFRGARVLDAGCGGGYHAELVASVAREVVALDLNVSNACRARLARVSNAVLRQGELVGVTSDELGGPFDVVYSVGVLQHTDDPDRAFANLVRLLRPGGRIIVWVYSWEGNGVARNCVEPIRRLILSKLPRQVLWALSWAITIHSLVPMHTLYRLPLRGLPLYAYLGRSRGLAVRKVAGNVFDKLNAPHTDFIRRERIEAWLAHPDLADANLGYYLGVSWRATAVCGGLLRGE